MNVNLQKKLTFLSMFAASTIICSPAHADGFNGGRLEATVGWDSVKGKLSYEDTDFPEDNFSESRSTDGIVYGGTAGYDFPLGERFFAGVEGSFELSDNKKCEELFGDDAACFKVKRNFAAGARFGTVVGDKTAFYVGAAYVNGKARLSYTDNLDSDNNFALSDNRDGYRLSTGVEHNLTSMLYLKVEYRYSNYNDYAVSEGTETLRLGFDRHQVVGGLGARF